MANCILYNSFNINFNTYIKTMSKSKDQFLHNLKKNKRLKNQQPTTIQGKARRWFKNNGLTMEMERGAYYIVISEQISVQITEEEVQARSIQYDYEGSTDKLLCLLKDIQNFNL